jgi:O-antigen/teichoic acid export membrane protein
LVISLPIFGASNNHPLSSIKQLAGQTLWYGLSNVAGRFLNYLLTFLHVYLFQSVAYGDVSVFYANAAILSIFFTYGMETAYFRFAQDEKNRNSVYNTGTISLLITSIIFSTVLILFRQPVANFMKIGSHPQWISWLAMIVAADTLAALPFSVLRQQNRPRKYATIKLVNIFLTIAFQVFFFMVYPKIFGKTVDIGYVFLSNLIASLATLLLLWKEIAQLQLKFDYALWKKMMVYAMPLIIVGFGGMINETIDRQLILRFWDGTVNEAKSAIGIYSANYKLAILIVLFIQAFRMGAEPFFFQQSADKNAPKTYARVMKFFVIACCLCFLFIVLFLDVWKMLITTKFKEFGEGIMIVPILALAKIFLGVYYNLSIWYKLTDKNTYGAIITIIGAVITITVNITLLPVLGYFASAWATLLCYSFMMIASFYLGQKYYPIPYARKKLLAYIVLCVLLFGVHQLIRYVSPSVWINYAAAILLLTGFIWFVLRIEKNEFAKIPYLNKLVR